MTKQQVIDILEAYKPSGNIYNGYNSIEEKIDERICYLIDEIIESVKREPDDDSEWIILSDKITMDDLKSRQAAIEEIEPYTDDIYNSTAIEIKEILQRLPSVQPERKTGRWILNKHTDTVLCSQCGKCYGDEYNYCPNCGAKMEGGD